MKRQILLFFTCIALIFSFKASKAQTVIVSFNEREIPLIKDTCAQLTAFTVRQCEGKMYLHWDVKDQKNNGLYIIYRSSDDSSYELLGYKEGVGVPVSAPIAYYFQDEDPCEATIWYKLIHIAENNTYLVSDKISVRSNMDLSSNQKGIK